MLPGVKSHHALQDRKCNRQEHGGELRSKHASGKKDRDDTTDQARDYETCQELAYHMAT
jgi:hypothetical protein